MRIVDGAVNLTQEEFEKLPKVQPELLVKGVEWISYSPQGLQHDLLCHCSCENFPEVVTHTFEGYVIIIRRVQIVKEEEQSAEETKRIDVLL